MKQTARGWRPSFVHAASFLWSAYLLGFALGGFFDGILLHQILQWHHLLSGIAPNAELRFLLLWDGIFHGLMYVIAVAGLWLMMRSRREFAVSGADSLFMGNALIGFGAWHLIDAVLAHWIFGLHHVRMDVENVLFWDLLWFFLFGVAFVAAGFVIRRNPARVQGWGRGPRLLTVAVLVAGPLAAMPPRGDAAALIVFSPATAPAVAMDAIANAGGGLFFFDHARARGSFASSARLNGGDI